jgi:hypothetical protein
LLADYVRRHASQPAQPDEIDADDPPEQNAQDSAPHSQKT